MPKKFLNVLESIILFLIFIALVVFAVLVTAEYIDNFSTYSAVSKLSFIPSILLVIFAMTGFGNVLVSKIKKGTII